jgi:nitroimidazol reductase NimA-like FMN-containing flavoprotein (pyridoxamine 5'-phosphate oxidase superfamily)
MIGQLTDSEIDHLLRSESVGRIGCCAEGRVYVVPVTYAVADGDVFGHSSVGMKVRMMRANPRVCFEVDRVVNQSNWQSVIAWGTYEELQGDDALIGVERLIERLGPLVLGAAGASGHKVSPSVVTLAHAILQQGVVYRIRLTERTGRFERIIG